MKINDKNQPYVIIRGKDSGVFAGFLQSKTGTEVELSECRRMWKWAGASSISELALLGVAKPRDCKVPDTVIRHCILDVIEIIPCSIKAYNSIKSIPIWTQH